jgi:hypothetical protein
MISQQERYRRWQLAIGAEDEQGELSERDSRLNAALSALYDSGSGKRRGGLGASSPRVAKWLGDIREFFPTPVVQIVQRDAFERLNLRALMPGARVPLDAGGRRPSGGRSDRTTRGYPRQDNGHGAASGAQGGGRSDAPPGTQHA